MPREGNDNGPPRERPVYYAGHMVLGLLFVGLASISWGTTGAVMTLLARETGATPLLVGWARLAVAAPCLVVAAVASGHLAARRGPAVALPWGALSALPTFALLGLAMALYQVCYFTAVSLTGVAVAALLAICSAPILIALLAALFLGERVTPAVRASLAIAVVGTALLVVGPRGLGQISARFGLGALLALGAGLSYAVFAVAAKGVLARIDPLPVAAATFALAALFLSPVVAREPSPWAHLGAGWRLVLYLGVGPTAIAYVLFTVGLRRVPATAAGVASLLEPLTASLLGVIAFGESLGAAGAAGALLLMIALATLALAHRARA